MAKIKVYNLAAEVGKPNREIIDYLTSKGYGPITAVTAVPENEVANIRELFGKKTEGAEAAPKTDAPAADAKKGAQESDDDKAKHPGSGFVRVYRSQNASKQLQRRPKKPSAPARPDEGRGSSSSARRTGPDVSARTGSAGEVTPLVPAGTESLADAAKGSADAAKGSSDAALTKAPETPASAASAKTEVPKGTVAASKEAANRAGSTPSSGSDEKAVSRTDAAPAQGSSEKAADSVSQKVSSTPSAGSSSGEASSKASAGTSSAQTASKASAGSSAAQTSSGASSAQTASGVSTGVSSAQTASRAATAGSSAQTAEKQSSDGIVSGNETKGRKNPSPRKTGQALPQAKGTSAAGKPAASASKPGSAAAGRPASSAAGRPGAKAADDGGFRNGRIIRSYGAAARTSSLPTRGGRGGRAGSSRDGQTSNGERRSYTSGGDRNGRGGRTDRSYSSTGRGQFTQGGRTGSAPGRGSAQGRGGQGGFAGRGGRPGAGGASQGADNSFSRKSTRSYRSDGKDRDRAREDRRELGHGRGDSARNGAFGRGGKGPQRKGGAPQEKKAAEVVTEIRVPERITVRDLADKMKLNAAQIVKELFLKGTMVTVNHELTYEQAEEIALDHDILCEKEEKEDVIGELLAEEEDDAKDMVPRPPVVVVMGHVDHGKTSLLDAIRHTHVTDREAGGITQHIGAYMVSINGQKITFLDTPGHEAFTAMRMRGANSTDIAVLVVAADDGVMPQTVEAINHAKAANVEIIVAINKIDKPGANVDRVKQELSEYGLVSEDWGGSTVFCPVSAKTHEGLDNLLEMILLTSEVMELRANPNRKARGIVLEAKLDKGRGPVASILIQKGTLHQGDYVACGAAHGKVRAMTDENGKRLHSATPSMPVEITGLSEVPEAGEVLVGMDSDKEARDFAAVFVAEGKKSLVEETRHQMSLDDLFKEIKEGDLKELPIVVKADVQGSVEAVSQSLVKLSNDEVVVKIIHSGVGAISESDVSLAAASGAIIIGFNVRPDTTAKAVAEQQKVDIHIYNVIYEAIDDVERALKGMRAAVYEEQVQGHAEIRQIFKASGVGNIAGAYVKDGIITRSSKVRVLRGGEKLWEGELASLKRFKDDAKEVREGFECGIVLDGFGDFEVDDIIEAYTMVQVEPE